MVSFNIFKKPKDEKSQEESYLEVIPTEETNEVKVWIRIFPIKDSSEIKAVVDTLREGNNIVIVDIRKFRESKDIVELKRAINKIKSVVSALNGDIGMYGQDLIIATPSFARIYRGYKPETKEEIQNTSNTQ